MLIAVRGGSKRVPRKNIKPFCNTSLLEIKIKQGLRLNEISEVVVSSDDEEILKKKFTLSIQTMVAFITSLISLIGMWYALQADIQANVFKIDTLEKEVERLRNGEGD